MAIDTHIYMHRDRERENGRAESNTQAYTLMVDINVQIIFKTPKNTSR